MNTQAGIVLNLILWGTVLSQPVIGIQPHQRFRMLQFHPQAGQDLLLIQKKQLDEPPINPGSPDERVPAGTHKSKGLARVEDEPTPPKEQIPGGSRWITQTDPRPGILLKAVLHQVKSAAVIKLADTPNTVANNSPLD